MRKTTLALLIGGGVLAGCATETPRYPIAPPPPRPAPPPALPPAPVLGPATVIGRMGPAGRPGASWSCEGQSAVLLPATAATIARMQGLYGSTISAVLPVETVRRHAATIADKTAPEPPSASGACTDSAGFTLSGVRPGGYFVVARARLRDGSATDSYALMRRVNVRAAETVVVTLPDPEAAPARAPARRATPARPKPRTAVTTPQVQRR